MATKRVKTFDEAVDKAVERLLNDEFFIDEVINEEIYGITLPAAASKLIKKKMEAKVAELLKDDDLVMKLVVKKLGI